MQIGSWLQNFAQKYTWTLNKKKNTARIDFEWNLNANKNIDAKNMKLKSLNSSFISY
jgi:hypothetical protein